MSKPRDPTVARSIGLATHAARSLPPAARLFATEVHTQARLLASAIGGTSEQAPGM